MRPGVRVSWVELNPPLEVRSRRRRVSAFVWILIVAALAIGVLAGHL